jgi:hypothetical protein
MFKSHPLPAWAVDSGLKDKDIRDNYYRYAFHPDLPNATPEMHSLNGKLIIISAKIEKNGQNTTYRISEPLVKNPSFIIDGYAHQLYPVIGQKALWKNAVGPYDMVIYVLEIYANGTALIEADLGDTEYIDLNEIEWIKADWEYNLSKSSNKHKCKCPTQTLMVRGCVCGGS